MSLIDATNRSHPNLLAHYRFESTQANLGIDASGNGNNGTNYGATQGVGKFGGGAIFDGSSSIRMPDVFYFNAGKSMSLWIDLTDVDSTQYFIGDETNNAGIRYSGTGNTFLFYATGATSSTYTTKDYDAVEGFVHLVVNRTTLNNINWYINGASIGSSVVGSTSSLVVNNIGMRSSDNPYYFNGALDEIKFWDRNIDERNAKRLMLGKNPI